MSNIWANAKQAKWVLVSFVGGTWFLQKTYFSNLLLNDEVFGSDGNGGRMLKIVTDLTDEEIAKLKFSRRLAWHWRGTYKFEG